MPGMTLYGRRGWGSVLIEAQLDWYGLDYEFREVGDLFRSAEARHELAEVNPIAQIPTPVMADGTEVTESAATRDVEALRETWQRNFEANSQERDEPR